MEIIVERRYKKKDYTIGKLYIDGKYFCDTLEDTDRGLTDSMSEEQIKKIKVYGQTAIPTGRYRVTISYSAKFKRDLPYINYVKGFEGIRIHSGNTAKDTFGCLLVGVNKEVGKVLDSKVTFNKLFDIIKSAKDKVYITYK